MLKELFKDKEQKTFIQYDALGEDLIYLEGEQVYSVEQTESHAKLWTMSGYVMTLEVNYLGGEHSELPDMTIFLSENSIIDHVIVKTDYSDSWTDSFVVTVKFSDGETKTTEGDNGYRDEYCGYGYCLTVER